MKFTYDELDSLAISVSGSIQESMEAIRKIGKPRSLYASLQIEHLEDWLSEISKIRKKINTEMLRIEKADPNYVEPCPYHERGLECRNSAPAGFDEAGEPYGDQGCGCAQHKLAVTEAHKHDPVDNCNWE